jgi:hypothetical protein
MPHSVELLDAEGTPHNARYEDFVQIQSPRSPLNGQIGYICGFSKYRVRVTLAIDLPPNSFLPKNLFFYYQGISPVGKATHRQMRALAYKAHNFSGGSSSEISANDSSGSSDAGNSFVPASDTPAVDVYDPDVLNEQVIDAAGVAHCIVKGDIVRILSKGSKFYGQEGHVRGLTEKRIKVYLTNRDFDRRLIPKNLNLFVVVMILWESRTTRSGRRVSFKKQRIPKNTDHRVEFSVQVGS